MSEVDRHSIRWLFWKVALPAGLVLMWWPLYKFQGVGHSFATALAHGELLTLAGLVFIDIGLELREAEGSSKQGTSKRAFALIEALTIFGILVLCSVGAVKSPVAEPPSDELSRRLTLIACFNITTMCGAIAAAVWWATKSATLNLEDQINTRARS